MSLSPEHILHALLLAKFHYILAFGGTGSSGPTLQQQQLATEQALTTANLNLEENSQRKSILNALQGTRVFRESALSRATAGNSSIPTPQGAPSAAQLAASGIPATGTSLLDISTGTTKGRNSGGSVGAVTAGGAGASGNVTPTTAGFGGNRFIKPGI